MSKYHTNCTNDPPERPNNRAGPALTSKPFCDCTICTCKHCPDILKLLCISVTENSCVFGSKVKKEKKETCPCPLHDLGQNDSILKMVNKDRDCTCGVVAHVVRSNIHMNIGMSERRAATNADEESSISQDIIPEK